MSRIIDLTLSLENGLQGVTLEAAKTVEKDGWNATTLHLYSHCGTHIDAPKHFGVTSSRKGESLGGEQTIDQIPLEKCMGPAWLADLSDIKPRSLITPADMSALEDKIRPGDSLLLRTGWSERVHSPAYRRELPRISPELAHWCVDKGIRMLGVEPPSVADVNNLEELTAVHKILLQGGIVIVEGLAHLDEIHKEKVTFMAFPLKIIKGDGSPVRAVAIEE